MSLTNSQVVPEILRGRDAENARGSFWGSGSPSRYTRANRGYIPRRVAESLDTVAEKHGGITGIIMSYATPLAVEIAGVWLRPDVTYSMTTSSKHAPNLWRLDARYLPADASVEDVENVIAGYTVYNPHTQKMSRGPVERPEAARARVGKQFWGGCGVKYCTSCGELFDAENSIIKAVAA